MSKDVQQTVEILSLTAAEDVMARKDGKVAFEISERDLRGKYLDAEAKSKYDQTFTSVDRTLTLKAFADSDAYKPYVPELYLDMALRGLTPKRTPYYNRIFPSTITVSRNDYAWLAVADETDANKKARWQFLMASNSPDQRRSTLVKRTASLRRYGHGAAWPNELLSDSPIDYVSFHMAKMNNKLPVFYDNWAVAELYSATTGDNATLYENTYQCLGTRSTLTKKGGGTENVDHGISADDILGAIAEQRGTTVETEVDNVESRGIDYYIPDVLLLTPTQKRRLAEELWRAGYSKVGPEKMGADVRTTAMLSDYFEIPIVVINPTKWDAKGEKIVADTSESAYLVDTTELGAMVSHTDGFKVAQWINNDNDQTIIVVRRRSDFLVMDNLAVKRLIPA